MALNMMMLAGRQVAGAVNPKKGLLDSFLAKATPEQLDALAKMHNGMTASQVQPGVAAPQAAAPGMDPNSVVRPGEFAPGTAPAAPAPPMPAAPAPASMDPNSVVRPGEMGAGSPAPAPTGVTGKPTLLSRVMGVARAANDTILETLNPVPAGMQGMFSDAELRSARPNLLRQLIGGPNTPSTREQFAQNLQGLQAQKDLTRFRESRAAVAQQFPAMPNETGTDAINRLKEMYAAYAANGDFDMMKQTGEVLKSIGGEGTRPTLREIDLGNRIELRDPYTGELVQTIQKPEGVVGGTPVEQQRMFQREQGLADDFRASTGRYAKVAEQVQAVRSVSAAAERGNTQAQMAVIFAYMKLLDPDSAVREGEYAKAENTRGVPDAVRNIYNRVLEGAFLTPEQVRSFSQRAMDLEKGWVSKFEKYKAYYTRRAQQWGVRPSNVIIDYFAADGARPAPTTPVAETPEYDRFFTP
jgi:hypothetical protein